MHSHPAVIAIMPPPSRQARVERALAARDQQLAALSNRLQELEGPDAAAAFITSQRAEATSPGATVGSRPEPLAPGDVDAANAEVERLLAAHRPTSPPISAQSRSPPISQKVTEVINRSNRSNRSNQSNSRDLRQSPRGWHPPKEPTWHGRADGQSSPLPATHTHPPPHAYPSPLATTVHPQAKLVEGLVLFEREYTREPLERLRDSPVSAVGSDGASASGSSPAAAEGGASQPPVAARGKSGSKLTTSLSSDKVDQTAAHGPAHGSGSPAGLYERGLRQRAKREAAMARRKREKEESEMKNCTFEPNRKNERKEERDKEVRALPVLRVGAVRVGAVRVGAARVGAVRVGAARVGAARVWVVRVGGAGAKRASFHLTRPFAAPRASRRASSATCARSRASERVSQRRPSRPRQSRSSLRPSRAPCQAPKLAQIASAPSRRHCPPCRRS